MSGYAAPQGASWRLWLHRHERALAGWYLGMVAGFALVLAVPPTRHAFLGALQRASDRWDLQWERRLAYGEMLVDAGRFAAAATFLERLDRAYPAPSVEHARDEEREQLLELLARSYEGLKRNRKTMATYDRLIAFDKNNYHSVYLKGQAAEHLLSGWAIAVEARDAYAAALKIFPSHLPSLRGYIKYYDDRGEFIPIVDVYRVYLNAFLVDPVTLTLGDTTVTVPILMDGLPHAVEVDVPRTGASSIVLRAGSFIFALDSASVQPRLRVGAPGRVTETRLPPASAQPARLERTAPGAWRPTGDSASLRLALPAGTGRLRLTMRVFKPMNRDLWESVAHSFHNLLDEDGRSAAEARTAVFEKANDADAALERPWWARSGLARVKDAR